MIGEIDSDCTFSSALTVDALSRVLPHETITDVIAQERLAKSATAV